MAKQSRYKKYKFNDGTEKFTVFYIPGEGWIGLCDSAMSWREVRKTKEAAAKAIMKVAKEFRNSF